MNQPNRDQTSRTGNELDRIGAAEELRLGSLRRDSSLRDLVTLWVVRDGADVCVRSANGRSSASFRGTRVRHEGRHEGRVWAGGVENDVSFEDADHALDDQIDAAYRTKYRHYAASTTARIDSAEARATTVRLVARTETPVNKEKES